MNTAHQKTITQRLTQVLIAYFVFVTTSAVLVYITLPSILTGTLFPISQASPYPFPGTLILSGIVMVVAILTLGVICHWRWVFWLLLVVFGGSIIAILPSILLLLGMLPPPGHLPLLWYSLFRLAVSVVQVVLAVWMVQIYRTHGVWGMGKKQPRQ
jgi:hypothetical protein